MARSIKKGPFVDQYLIDKVEKMTGPKTAIKTWSRRSMIIPDFVGHTFNVHNGSRFSRTIQTIQELEPDATVLEDGFTVSEQTVAEAAEDVAAWLEGLGY